MHLKHNISSTNSWTQAAVDVQLHNMLSPSCTLIELQHIFWLN